jgi:hypothetical protein
MADVRRVRTLELDEDLGFQRSEWRASRLTLAGLLSVMLAAGLGLFGNGPLSRARAGDPTGALWVDYDRFVRSQAATRLSIHARPNAHGSVHFTVSRSFLDAYRVMQVTPNPDSARVVPEGVEYRIGADPSGGGPVIFDVQPVQRWLVQGEIRSPQGSVRLRQFIYP